MEPSKILIVDDKEENLVALEYHLSDIQNIEIVKSTSGNEALKQTLTHQFACAILDVQMPEMDGYEPAELLRFREKTKTLPIIFVSAVYSDDYHIFKGYEAGAVDFILKPWEPKILLSKIKVFLELDQQKKELNKHRDHLEDIIQERTHELLEASAQLIQSEKLAGLGELAAGIMHELNQPLNVVNIICQTLLSEMRIQMVEKENLELDLKDVLKQSKKMSSIINHMRTFTRSSQMVESDCENNVNDIIGNIVKMLEGQLIVSNIDLITEINPDLPNVKCNSIRLEQVFINLIINAKHALEESAKENKTIKLLADKLDAKKSVLDKESIFIEVKDNGNGIDDSIGEKIFQSFFTTKKAGKGTGLGLSVASKIIEEHKGKIELESVVGEGTTFRVLLPI